MSAVVPVVTGMDVRKVTFGGSALSLELVGSLGRGAHERRDTCASFVTHDLGVGSCYATEVEPVNLSEA